MPKGLLPEHIGPLVDRLRTGDHQAVSLPDVAALTEVLMRSLESYFKSIDLTIYQECQALADYIDDARQEISSLSPDHENSAGIPRAGLELEAIVQQTESATNTIMESAESIMEADSSNTETYTTIVNDAVMQIFEACSFQDITGQRISKVVSTLEHVENRVDRLINILGVMENSQNKKKETDHDKDLLNGPALEGEGIDQAEIDALLNGPAGDTSDGENDHQEAAEADSADSDQAVAEAPDVPPCEISKNTGTTTDSPAEDIDFMFDGQAKAGKINQEKHTTATTSESTDTETAPAKTEPDPIEAVKQKKPSEKKAEKKAATAEPVVYQQGAKAGIDPKPSENTTQSDIDALFS